MTQLIESHVNDIIRGDWVELDKALDAKPTNKITAIDPDDVFAGDFAEVMNVSFRANDRTRLRVRFKGCEFNLTYEDDVLLLVKENEQDKLEALKVSKDGKAN